MREEKEFQLIDVRGRWEHDIDNIGGAVVPVSRIMTGLDFFREDIPLVFYCEKGIRSEIACVRLWRLKFHNIYNLTGGMIAWNNMLAAEQNSGSNAN